MGRLNLLFFKQENCSLEIAERKGQRNGLLQSVWGFLRFREKVGFLMVDLTSHGDGSSPFFQEREGQDEKGLEIGKRS